MLSQNWQTPSTRCSTRRWSHFRDVHGESGGLCILFYINFHEIHPFGRNKCAYFCFHLPQARSVHRTSLSSPVEKKLRNVQNSTEIHERFSGSERQQVPESPYVTYIYSINISLHYYITILSNIIF